MGTAEPADLVNGRADEWVVKTATQPGHSGRRRVGSPAFGLRAIASPSTIVEWPWYPMLAVPAIVVTLFTDSSAAGNDLWRSLVVSLAMTAVVLAVVSLPFRSVHVGAVLTLLLAFAVFGFVVPTLLLVGALTATLVWGLHKRRRVAQLPWRRVNGVANAISMLVLLSTWTLALGALVPAEKRPAMDGAATPAGPDIYVLLLDGYPRSDTLASEFGYDNEEFLSRMSSQGFQTARESQSNYNMTALTLASMLSGAPVATLIPEPPSSAVAQFRALTRSISSGRLLGRLREVGYEAVSIPSPYSGLTISSADRILDSGDVTEFEVTLLQKGALRVLFPDQMRVMAAASHRHRIDAAFGSLRELARERRAQPKFVLAHIMAPHPPYVYGRDGDPIDPDCFPLRCGLWHVGDIYGENLTAMVADQVHHVNRLVADTTRSIIEASQRPPVVIVMSDHGHRHDMLDPIEGLRSLFIAYTPGAPELFPADVTPVNVLTRVLNAYHGMSLGLAPEERYFVDRRYLHSRGPLAAVAVP